MATIGAISAFINNTAAVAVFIPIVIEVCRRTGPAPAACRCPMSHAATFGGMCTLVGTSTNLVAHEYARSQGLPGFSMFELGKVGLPVMAAGFAYMLFVGRWFLPSNRAEEPLAAAGAASRHKLPASCNSRRSRRKAARNAGRARQPGDRQDRDRRRPGGRRDVNG
jgi:di/tricarboxylate transporter